MRGWRTLVTLEDWWAVWLGILFPEIVLQEP